MPYTCHHAGVVDCVWLGCNGAASLTSGVDRATYTDRRTDTVDTADECYRYYNISCTVDGHMHNCLHIFRGRAHSEAHHLH